MFWECFFPGYGLPFHFLNSIFQRIVEVPIFDEVQFIYSFLLWVMFSVLCLKFFCCLIQDHKDLLCFFSKSFIVLALASGPLWVNFFIWCQVRIDGFFFVVLFCFVSAYVYVYISVVLTPFVENTPSSIKLTWCLCCRSVYLICEASILFCWCLFCLCQICCLDD